MLHRLLPFLVLALFAALQACTGVGRESVQPGPSGSNGNTDSGHQTPDALAPDFDLGPTIDTGDGPAPDSVGPFVDALVPPDICVPSCAGKSCGDDGCGGSCGTCPPGVPCIDGSCLCTPDCWGKECGPDGCGGVCGVCPPGLDCIDGLCGGCIPDCAYKECGDDGCGGSCGLCPCPTCPPDHVQCLDFQCVSVSSGSDCAMIFECFETCAEGDQACYQNCVNNASIEGQMAYNDLIVCLDQSGYFDCPQWDQECSQETFAECYDPYFECFHGDMECVDMYLCAVNCPDDGGACSQECMQQGTVAAQKTWLELTTCLQESGYYDCNPNDEACTTATWSACDEVFKECTHGDLTCSEIRACMEDCGPWEEMCTWTCLFHGTIVAQEQYEALYWCLEEVCGNTGDPECYEKAMVDECGAEAEPCY